MERSKKKQKRWLVDVFVAIDKAAASCRIDCGRCTVVNRRHQPLIFRMYRGSMG